MDMHTYFKDYYIDTFKLIELQSYKVHVCTFK